MNCETIGNRCCKLCIVIVKWFIENNIYLFGLGKISDGILSWVYRLEEILNRKKCEEIELDFLILPNW